MTISLDVSEHGMEALVIVAIIFMLGMIINWAKEWN